MYTNVSKPTGSNYTNLQKIVGAWDLAEAVFSDSVSIVANSENPEGLYIRGDGKKVYILDTSNDNVSEYEMVVPWEITTLVFTQTLDVGAQDSGAEAIFFKPDGLKMYMLGITGDRVYEYDLSVAWDISTAVNNATKSISAQDTTARGLFFKYDGLKMYLSGSQNDKIYEYDLTTAWDVTTASFLQDISIASQTTSPDGIFFRSDGKKMYMVDGDKVIEYGLSTAWNISTLSFEQLITPSQSGGSIFGLSFSPDGTDLILTNGDTHKLDKYELTTDFTMVPKPTGYAILGAGMTMGLLMPLTYPTATTVGNPYININKPT